MPTYNLTDMTDTTPSPIRADNTDLEAKVKEMEAHLTAALDMVVEQEGLIKGLRKTHRDVLTKLEALEEEAAEHITGLVPFIRDEAAESSSSEEEDETRDERCAVCKRHATIVYDDLDGWQEHHGDFVAAMPWTQQDGGRGNDFYTCHKCDAAASSSSEEEDAKDPDKRDETCEVCGREATIVMKTNKFGKDEWHDPNYPEADPWVPGEWDDDFFTCNQCDYAKHY